MAEKKFKKKSVLDEIEKLMKYEVAGDPMSDLKWTRKTRQKIADELSKIGIEIGKTTVGRILKNMKFTLKSNSKCVSGGGKKLTVEEKKMRNDQFLYIEKIRKEFEQKGLPVMSCDSKKKELIGNFKNFGTRLRRDKDLVNDHDFITYAIGKALLYGIFDENRKEGFVYIGQSFYDRKNKNFTSSDTPEFAVECIARWWKEYGAKKYLGANKILILVDAGGSNGYRVRLWKLRIQELLCSKYGLEATIAHYPPGASKWNCIEHRLFSQVSKNWAGVPLISFETVEKYIRTTKTTTGLKVKARMIKKQYEKGKSASDEMFNNFKKSYLRPYRKLPDWNYTIF